MRSQLLPLLLASASCAGPGTLSGSGQATGSEPVFAGSVEIRPPRISVESVGSATGGEVEREAETLLEYALNEQGKAGATPEKRARLWSLLVDMEEGNPYLAQARKACADNWGHSDALVDRELAILRDYSLLASYLALPGAPAERKRHASAAFLAAHGALAESPLVVAAKQGGAGELLPEASTILGPACEQGDPRQCAVLGTGYHRGIGLPQDHGRAREPLGRACAKDIGSACLELGRSTLAQGNPTDARVLWGVACGWGHPPSCSELATRRKQRGVPGDASRTKK